MHVGVRSQHWPLKGKLHQNQTTTASGQTIPSGRGGFSCMGVMGILHVLGIDRQWISRILPDSPENNLQWLWLEIRKAYKSQKSKCRLNQLKMKMIDGTPFPKLKAKASETKHLLKPVAAVLQQILPDHPVPELHEMFILVTLSSKLDEILDASAGPVLAPAAARDLKAGLFGLQPKGWPPWCWRAAMVRVPCTLTIHLNIIKGFTLPCLQKGPPPKSGGATRGRTSCKRWSSFARPAREVWQNENLMEKVAIKYLWALDMLLGHVGWKGALACLDLSLSWHANIGCGIVIMAWPSKAASQLLCDLLSHLMHKVVHAPEIVAPP